MQKTQISIDFCLLETMKNNSSWQERTEIIEKGLKGNWWFYENIIDKYWKSKNINKQWMQTAFDLKNKKIMRLFLEKVSCKIWNWYIDSLRFKIEW